MTAAEEIAKKLRKIASDPKVKRILLTIPKNYISLPVGKYSLGLFLKLVAAALEGKL